MIMNHEWEGCTQRTAEVEGLQHTESRISQESG
jgi:hypothetical protein